MKVGTMWIQMIRRLFGKRTKVHRLPKEKVTENGTNDLKEEFADENKDQEHLQAEMKTSQKRLEDSHEILLSLHMIFRKHAECSENLLSEMEKLIDAIKKTKTADMEVSQAITPVPGSFSPSSSSFSSSRIQLPPIKNLQHFSVGSLHTDDAKLLQSFKLAWAANESSNDTEETFLTGTEKNEIELQTVDELSTEQETRSLTIDNIQNEPLDGKIRRLEMQFQAEIDKREGKKLKLKLEMAEAKQRRQKKTKDLKLKIKCLEKEAKREKQERKQKLKDLEKEIKNEKAMLLLKLKELKKKLKMEIKEECNEKKMEENRKDDEEVDDPENKNVRKILFKNVGFRRCKAV